MAVLVFSEAVPALAQPSGVTAYEVASIGVLEGHEGSFIEELDEFGRVVAWSRAFSGQTYSVLWFNGELFTPPVPPGGETANLFGISPTSGLLVGDSMVNQGSRAAAWRIGVGSTLLSSLGGSLFCLAGTANDFGWMVGGCSAANRSALWPRLDPPIDLGSLGNQFGDEGANDINAQGEIVGRSYNAQRITRPYLWRDGQMIDIGGEPTNAVGFAYGINDLTEVVGYFSNPPPGRREAYFWRNGEITVLPEPYPCGGGLQKAYEINNAGLIVGQAPDAECGQLYGAIWDRDDGFHAYLLNDLIPRHPDVTLITADDVNEAGQIAAYGELVGGQGRGFLVTPYLFEMSDPVPGRAGTQNTVTITGLQPNQRVHLVWGTREGAQKIHSGCAGGTLLIRDPQALPAVRADANGVATITVNVPLIARGRTIRMQAVAPVECQISHTVTWVFE
ncbi:MAG: hypothetical protein KJZ69_08765 [Phycisphaerales bacterium]|nr:hypothetical protein [Phycisphaerales bacterium]